MEAKCCCTRNADRCSRHGMHVLARHSPYRSSSHFISTFSNINDRPGRSLFMLKEILKEQQQIDIMIDRRAADIELVKMETRPVVTQGPQGGDVTRRSCLTFACTIPPRMREMTVQSLEQSSHPKLLIGKARSRVMSDRFRHRYGILAETVTHPGPGYRTGHQPTFARGRWSAEMRCWKGTTLLSNPSMYVPAKTGEPHPFPGTEPINRICLSTNPYLRVRK